MHELKGNIERESEGNLKVVDGHKWSLKSSVRLWAVPWLSLTQQA